MTFGPDILNVRMNEEILFSGQVSHVGCFSTAAASLVESSTAHYAQNRLDLPMDRCSMMSGHPLAQNLMSLLLFLIIHE